GQAWLAPIDRRVRSASRIADIGSAEEGQLVLAEPAGRFPRSGVNVVETLGNPLAPNSFSLIAIAKYGIPHVFSSEVLDEAERAANISLEGDRREDLRDIPIVAIDPADARDHDDAIWAEPDGDGGFRALVAIADVSFYVRSGGALDREARKRGNSVYFPDRVVPMLPEILSANVCSLREDEDRAAMVCHLQINSQGKVTAYRFARALVRIAHNLAYEEAQRQIDSGEADDILRHLWACWNALNTARQARDPLELELPERQVRLDDQGKIAAITMRERLDAHRVVEDFMITANVAAAKALESKASPVVYRVHEPPNREKLIALRDYLQTLDINLALGQVITPGVFNRLLSGISDEAEKAQLMEAVLRSQTQAYYSPRNSGHFGLALGSYSHFTSPIRRYSDLLVHRALVDAWHLEQPAPKDASLPVHTGLPERDRDKLSQITDALSEAERRAMEAERDTLDRYVAAYLSDRTGEIFETRITGVQSFGFFATIIGLGGDGLVPVSTLGAEHFTYNEKERSLSGDDSGDSYTLGQRVKLRLAEANALTGALKFEPVDSEGMPIEPRGSRPSDNRKYKPKRGHQQGRRGRPANIRHQGRRR
ncbi:MAG: ribonuclease R family protein, partial [Sphingomonadaceae bacterium]